MGSRFHTTAPLPSLRSTRASPSSEPTASPSGDRWLVSRKRLPCRISDSRLSGAVLFVVLLVVVMMQRLQEGGDVHAVLGPAVERELQLGGGPQAQARAELAAEETGGMLERGDGALASGLLAHHRDGDPRLAQVGGDVDLGDRGEAHAGIGELAQD